MRKYIILFLAFVLILSGCNQVTQSINTKTTESQPADANDKETSDKKEETMVAASEDVASSELIAPIYSGKPIKSNKPEMKLENIILKVKDALNIGNEYDEVSTEEYSSEGSEKSYNVNLYNTDNNESAWFSTDVFGNLISFNKYIGYDVNVETNYTKAEAENKGRELLVKLYGEPAKEFQIEDKFSYNTFENQNYSLHFVRVVNGVKVPSDTISLDISKKTLDVVGFQLMNRTNNDFSDTSYFASIDNAKAEDEAFEKYKESNMMLKGYLGFNSEKMGLYRKLKYIPIYGIFENQVSIDAITLEPNFNLVELPIMYGMGAAEEADRKSELSPTEQAHIDDLKNQHSAEDAEKAAREMFGLGNDYKISYSNFGNYMSTKGIYIWSLSFKGPDEEYVSVTLLANDLTLVSYNRYGREIYQNRDEKTSTKSADSKSADSYVSIANNFLTEKGNLDLDDLEISTRSNKPQTSENHTVNYVRKTENGLFVYTDTIYVTINKKTDQVANYSRSWDFQLDESTLPDSFGITKEEAFEILKDNYGFKLVYERDYNESDTKSVKPYYMLEETSLYNRYENYIVNGENGDVINQSGEKVQLYGKIVYSDIDQAQRPKIIEEMAENGIGFYDGDLNPKEKITQIQLFRLFLASNGYYGYDRNLTDDQVYDQLSYLNLLDGEEKEPGKIITQKDYARYIARYKSYGEIGKLNSIFKDQFDDLSSSDKDFGYLAIAKEKGYIETNSDNRLEPNKEITREMALYYLYALKLNR